MRWLGPGAGPADLSLASLAAYQRELAERGLSSQTVRKDRAALNAWLRWLAEHELVDPARPGSPSRSSYRAPRSRSASVLTRCREQYCRLVAQAEATVARDPLLGWHDVAIVRVVAEAGLRCEELIRLERRDLLPARRGAQLRALEVRQGKGDRRRRVRLAPAATKALLRWDRERRGSDAVSRPAAANP